MDTNTTPKAYAICHLTEVDFGPEIIEYLEKIDATLAPSAAASSCTAATSRSPRASWPATS